MIERSMKTLEFNKILEQLGDYAVSQKAREKLLQLRPFLNEEEVNAKIAETTQARTILDRIGTPPLASMKDIELFMDSAQKGAMLIAEQLTQILLFINACRRMKSFLKRAESLNVSIAGYGRSIQELTTLSEEIEHAIRNNSIDDNASKELKDIRKRIAQVQSEMKLKLESQLRSKKQWFTEDFVSIRNGHFVLPVKREYKNMLQGSVLDISSSGSTYFMEPAVVSKLKEELSVLEIAQSNEERRILYELSALVCEYAPSIYLNMEAMEALDFIFAKAKLSLDMNAIPAVMSTKRLLRIENGRHPFISPSQCVPLNFTIGEDISGIVITGPNTGGKTVALKTVGLFSLMAQSGLHVPCDYAELCMNNAVLCDIGDGQSITENLSTFSSHITNIINILNHVSGESLVLLDELGSGTDPAEGMGIAIAILEELSKRGCLFVATTHYPQVKEYASQTQGLVNARMAFDRESLRPLYRLEIGEAGESCALFIAKRLGLPGRLLERAYQAAYGNEKMQVQKNIHPEFSEIIKEESKYNPDPPAILPKIQKAAPARQVNTRSQHFTVGDSVLVYPQKKIGIVFQTADEKGYVGVQIQKKKEFINHKRLQLKVAATEMYPEDYDFSIIFDSVANRKARHKMEKGHQEGLEILYEKPDQPYPTIR